MTDSKKESPEYIAMRDLALSQLHSGKSLTGEGGVFAPIIKELLENVLLAILMKKNEVLATNVMKKVPRP